MTPTPKLIDLEDVLSQAQGLQHLLNRLKDLPKLPTKAQQTWFFVAEGSSYHAVQWQWNRLFQAHPNQRAFLLYPWELELFLESPTFMQTGIPFVVAVSQSGKTASLLRSLQKAQQRWGVLEGLLLTNASPESLDVTAWQGLTPLFLEAGREDAIAATKTFMLSAFTLEALLHQNSTSQKLEALIPEMQRVLEDLDKHPKWQDAVHLFTSSMTQPIVAIGAASVMPILSEVHLKLTETLSRPVLTYHHEGFKHGPRSMLHRKQAHWPLLIYAPSFQATDDFYADAYIHLQHLDAPHASRLHHLWIRCQRSKAVPEALLTLGQGVDLAINTSLPEDVLLLLVIQRLACAVVDALGLKVDGLTKYVAQEVKEGEC